MALGAEAKTVRWMFVRQGGQVALLGVVVGALAAAGLTRYIQTLLFDVGRLDVTAFAGDVCRDACGRAARELHPGAARLACGSCGRAAGGIGRPAQKSGATFSRHTSLTKPP